jgi:fructose-bisphosphate aldolase class II/tagatose 1,6-diphosphate aldolase GatY/KbaY
VDALIKAGIAKINIDAAVKGAFRTALIDAYSAADPIVDTRAPMKRARDLAVAAVEERIDWFGARGKAD